MVDPPFTAVAWRMEGGVAVLTEELEGNLLPVHDSLRNREAFGLRDDGSQAVEVFLGPSGFEAGSEA
jgi:hypothetical protein